MTAVAFTCLICGLPHGFDTPGVLLAAAEIVGIGSDPRWVICESCTPLLNARQINWNAVHAARIGEVS